MEELKKLRDSYRKLSKEANYDNDHLNDIAYYASQALHWGKLVGTEADKDTFGEFTRRFEREMGELERLMRD
jgi:hypothetical protein